MATRNIVPRATGEGSLGTEAKKWGNIYADNLHSSNPLPIANGGTGATTVAGARNALGLGNTAGALPVANGGTGATTVAGARNALGLGNTTGALPVANGGTGATTVEQACTNIGALPTSGGTMTGAIQGQQTDETGYSLNNTVNGCRIKAGEFGTASTGAYLDLYKGNGNFELATNTGYNGARVALQGNVNGSLTWNGKNVERVNTTGSNYVRFESGLQICWGSATVQGSTDVTITLPIAFKDANWTLSVLRSSSSDAKNIISIWQRGSLTKTSFNVYSDLSNQYTASVRYLAIGFWK